MKPILKDEPKEWRKSALLATLGLAILSSLLRWRHILSNAVWFSVLALLGVVAVCALLQPRWFRGWHRFSTWLGFAVSQFIGRIVLTLFFFLVLTPVGLILRLSGKDALELKPPSQTAGYWHPAKNYGPLDRLF